MKVIGFNLKKINAERFEDSLKKGLKAGVDMNIKNIKKVDTDIFKNKDEVIQVDFSYKVDYKPDFAKVDMEGAVIFSMDSKQSKSILKDWKKENVSEDFRITVFNVVLKKASLKALSLEEELNLPLHMPLPSFKKKK